MDKRGEMDKKKEKSDGGGGAVALTEGESQGEVHNTAHLGHQALGHLVVAGPSLESDGLEPYLLLERHLDAGQFGHGPSLGGAADTLLTRRYKGQGAGGRGVW